MSASAIATTLTIEALKPLVNQLATNLVDKMRDANKKQARDLLQQLKEDYPTGAYVENYVSKIARMRTLSSVEADVSLDQIYTPLRLKVCSHQDEFAVDDGTTITCKNIVNIIGIAGQGKSTILKKLFFEELRNKERFPFLIELKELYGRSIINTFTDQLKNIGLSCDDESIAMLLQTRRVVLMLDGYDEVISSERYRVMAEITQLNERYNCYVIVTTRPGTEICNVVGVNNLKVMDLTEGDILSIISKLDQRSGVSYKDGNENVLSKLVRENRQLRETLVSPILVNLLYVCYPYLDVVPKNVVDFYDKLFITLYSRHDKIKVYKRETRAKLSAAVANKVFNSFCFFSLLRREYDFNDISIVRTFEEAMDRISIKYDSAEDVRDDLIDSTSLIQTDGVEKYVFTHKSIQEFHAARFVALLDVKSKETVYAKLLRNLELQDSFDNMFVFLKDLEPDNYNALLVLEFFKQKGIADSCDLTKSGSVVETLFNDMLKKFNLTFWVCNGKLTLQKHGVDLTNDLISTLSFLKSNSRECDSFTHKKITSLVDGLIIHSETDGDVSADLDIAHLRSVSSYQGSDVIKKKEGDLHIDVIVADLVSVMRVKNVYSDFLNVFRREIIKYYYDVFVPVNSAVANTVKALDFEIDFSL